MIFRNLENEQPCNANLSFGIKSSTLYQTLTPHQLTDSNSFYRVMPDCTQGCSDGGISVYMYTPKIRPSLNFYGVTMISARIAYCETQMTSSLESTSRLFLSASSPRPHLSPPDSSLFLIMSYTSLPVSVSPLSLPPPPHSFYSRLKTFLFHKPNRS